MSELLTVVSHLLQCSRQSGNSFCSFSSSIVYLILAQKPEAEISKKLGKLDKLSCGRRKPADVLFYYPSVKEPIERLWNEEGK